MPHPERWGRDDAYELTAHWGDVHDGVEVDVETLPTILRRFDVPFDFGLLSVDAEGEGFNLLEDAFASGYRPRWIIFEVYEGLKIDSLDELPLSAQMKAAYEIAGRTFANLIVRLK